MQGSAGVVRGSAGVVQGSAGVVQGSAGVVLPASLSLRWLKTILDYVVLSALLSTWRFNNALFRPKIGSVDALCCSHKPSQTGERACI